jgi:hypothetical protein
MKEVLTMTDKYKELLRAQLENKKNIQVSPTERDKQGVYKGQGAPRKGIRQKKGGGFFDK